MAGVYRACEFRPWGIQPSYAPALTEVPMEFGSEIGGCGVEVRGVQLAHLGDDEFARLREAFVRYGVLFFRDQDFAPTTI